MSAFFKFSGNRTLNFLPRQRRSYLTQLIFNRQEKTVAALPFLSI